MFKSTIELTGGEPGPDPHGPDTTSPAEQTIGPPSSAAVPAEQGTIALRSTVPTNEKTSTPSAAARPDSGRSC